MFSMRQYWKEILSGCERLLCRGVSYLLNHDDTVEGSEFMSSSKLWFILRGVKKEMVSGCVVLKQVGEAGDAHLLSPCCV